MSSLRSQSPLEYPQKHSPSFPLCPVWGTISQKKKQKSVILLCPSHVVPKGPRMAAVSGTLNPSVNHPLLHHFRILPAFGGFSTPASIPVFFQLYWAAIVSPGRCGSVVWSQSSPSSYAGSVTRGSCLPVTSWVEVTPIPLTQSMATAI